MKTARATILQISPPWLTRKWGSRVMYGFGIQLDALLELSIQSLIARFPDHAAPDALVDLGVDRKIRRGMREPDASYGARLKGWLLDRQMKGGSYALMRQMCGYMHGHTPTIYAVSNGGSWVGLRPKKGGYEEWGWDAPGSWNYDSKPDDWWRCWIIVNMPPSLWQDDGVWGDDGDWGDGGVWGCTATYEQVQSLIMIVKEWESSHAQCHGLIFTWQDDSFQPPYEWVTFQPPQGDWENAGKPDGAGNYVLARDPNAAISGRL